MAVSTDDGGGEKPQSVALGSGALWTVHWNECLALAESACSDTAASDTASDTAIASNTSTADLTPIALTERSSACSTRCRTTELFISRRANYL